MNRIGDRHKGTNRPSGYQKRKLSKEKASQSEKVVAKTPRITAFLQATATSTSAVTVDDGQNAGSSEPGVTGDAVVVVGQPPVQQCARSEIISSRLRAMVQKFVERQNMFKEEHVIKTCLSY